MSSLSQRKQEINNVMFGADDITGRRTFTSRPMLTARPVEDERDYKQCNGRFQTLPEVKSAKEGFFRKIQ